jgi:hypothetical protein
VRKNFLSAPAVRRVLEEQTELTRLTASNA